MTETLPDVAHTRDRLLAKVFAFRKDEERSSSCMDEDYEILYCYGTQVFLPLSRRVR